MQYNEALPVRRKISINALFLSALLCGTLWADGPAISVQPSQLNFAADFGGADPAGQTVNLSGDTNQPFAAASDSSWLAVGPAKGVLSSPLQVTASISGLQPGVYQGKVVVFAANLAGVNSATILVTLTVRTPSLAVDVPVSALAARRVR